MREQIIKPGRTKEEMIKDIEDRLFMLDMIDYQTSEDKEIIRELQELKREIEND